MALEPARTIPVRASLDIDESLALYAGQPGFSADRHGDCLLVRRDDIEIHFRPAEDRIHPDNTSCDSRGGQVAALHEECRPRGVPRLPSFEVRPWDMKEFHIHDPHGNLLRFGCAPRGAC
ncbi:MAG: VOC family protein [Rhodospirillales bacterium]|nr:MAG: VOC family protein [Rhodospirillales bacterium]